jgi:hypothetical protein
MKRGLQNALSGVAVELAGRLTTIWGSVKAQ